MADDAMQVPEVQAPARAAGNSRYAWPKERTLLSKPTRRVDGPIKATGSAKYPYDVTRPGMLYGRMLRSPHAHAVVKSVDLAPAQAIPGVKAALLVSEPGKKAMYQGDEIAAVAATTEEIAGDALRAIRVVTTGVLAASANSSSAWAALALITPPPTYRTGRSEASMRSMAARICTGWPLVLGL